MVYTLFENRHPLVGRYSMASSEAIFSEIDFAEEAGEKLFKRLSNEANVFFDNLANSPSSFDRGLIPDVIVSGYTPALVALLDVARIRGKALYLHHYNPATQDYDAQRFDKS